MLAQLYDLNTSYPIVDYVATLKRLLKENAQGGVDMQSVERPLRVRRVEFASKEHFRLDDLGAKTLLKSTAFILVAGGLGERLGLPSNRIKLSMPFESV